MHSRSLYTHTVPEYLEMHSAAATNYLVPITSRGTSGVDLYSEWREMLKPLILDQTQLKLTNSLGEGIYMCIYSYIYILLHALLTPCISLDNTYCVPCIYTIHVVVCAVGIMPVPAPPH